MTDDSPRSRPTPRDPHTDDPATRLAALEAEQDALRASLAARRHPDAPAPSEDGAGDRSAALLALRAELRDDLDALRRGEARP